MSEYVDEAPPEDPYATTPAPVDTAVLIEQRVIGAAMRHPHQIPDMQRAVTGGDFHDLRLGAIFNGLIGLHATGAPTDYLAVYDRLQSWDVRGIELNDLSRWQDDTTGDGVYWAGLVREASVRRLLADVGQRLQHPDTDPGVALARAQQDLRTITDMQSAGGKSVRWLRDVLDVPEEADAYDWVIPDLLERQDRLMLSAAEGSGKSTMLRQIAILAAAGIHPFQFNQIDPVNVLVVDAENSERQWRRAARGLADTAAQRGRRDPRNHLALHCVPVMDVTRANDLGQLHRWIDECEPALMLLGPLYRVAGGSSLNTDEDVAPLLAALDSIRERGVAMLLEVHAGHARSTSGERELRPRGSSALLGWPEFGLGLRRDKKVEGRHPTFSLVRWRGDRDRRDWPDRLVRGQIFPWEPSF
ncbi:AAA family ATPase [Microbacterium soli]|uniref:DNA helicase DnaB-like N-terminal domain-containing protein n=1 Tax=Microbacterium soli TaxID=446075 RepID=A0ABP7NIS9_9MICO